MLYPRSQDPKWQSRNFFTVKVFNHMQKKKKKMRTLYKEPPFTNCSDATFLKILHHALSIFFPRSILKQVSDISFHPYIPSSKRVIISLKKGEAFFF